MQISRVLFNFCKEIYVLNLIQKTICQEFKILILSPFHNFLHVH